MNSTRLAQQIQFIVEIDKLKQIIRRSYLIGGERLENSAEHSWHIAVMAMLLAEYAPAPVDLLRVIKMLLVHDIVEIDAGDTYVYDQASLVSQAERERQAAERLFGLLPEDQAREFDQLRLEFEARQTPEAKFARAMDRLMPLLHNYHSQGKSWQENGIKQAQVLALTGIVADGSDELWQFARSLIEDAVGKGYLPAK
jgi:putative hydrolase of HD superfamily